MFTILFGRDFHPLDFSQKPTKRTVLEAPRSTLATEVEKVTLRKPVPGPRSGHTMDEAGLYEKDHWRIRWGSTYCPIMV